MTTEADSMPCITTEFRVAPPKVIGPLIVNYHRHREENSEYPQTIGGASIIMLLAVAISTLRRVPSI